MLTVLSILAVLAVLFVAAAVATREGPILADAPADIADLGLPDGPLQPEDLQAVRFGLAIRGYRMAEVDAVLDRVIAELADRDRRLAEAGSKPDPADVPAIPLIVKSAVVVAPQPVVPVEPPLDSPPPPIEPPVEDEETPAAEPATHVDPALSVDADAPSVSDQPAAAARPEAPPVEVAVVPLELAPLPSKEDAEKPPVGAPET